MKSIASLVLILSLGLSLFIPLRASADYFQNYTGKATSATTTISSGGTASAALPLKGFVLVGISFPATFTGTTVTFQTSSTIGGTYQPVYNSAGQVSYTVAQARYYAIDPKDFHGVQYLKIVSGSTEGADRILTVSLKGVL